MPKVLCGGCFNQIHPGHIQFLKRARALGDFLIVVLAHDANNKKQNPKPARERKAAMEKLGIADRVIVGDKNDFLKVVRMHRPDIVALGYDQELSPEMLNQIRAMGIRIVRMDKFGQWSSSSM
jgi:FAD synthetase